MRKEINHKTKTSIGLLLLLLIFVMLGCREEAGKSEDKPVLRLATSTSTVDSGLLGILLPIFESRHDIQVEASAIGSAAALEAGREGEADVILAHSRRIEDAFVKDGYGVNRVDVMYNDYLLLGPPDDPAEVGKAKDILSALKKIEQEKATFVSRGDASGTNQREKELWKQAGVDTSGNWYINTDKGMLETLKTASKSNGYVIASRGSYFFNKADLNLVVVYEGNGLLLNVYSAIAVNPAKVKDVNFKAAMKFIDFLVSMETQEIISSFGKFRFGAPLYYPLGVQEYNE